MYKLVTGKTPFESEYHSTTIANIQSGEINFEPIWDNYGKFSKDLVKRLLKKSD